jgi:CubicO group peptidase (beta-lactamase class C family)
LLLSESAGAALADALTTWRHRHTVPGVALALTNARGDALCLRDGFADRERGVPVAPYHRFQIGSIGKSFTAIAMLRLAERGRVDLRAPVRRYLRWFEAGPTTRAISLHHLLTHTSGLPMGADFSDSSAFDVWALRDGQPGPPGRYWYSNAGYKALGLVLEAVEGRPYGEVVEREVLAPLEMAGSRGTVTLAERAFSAEGYEPEPDRYPLSQAPRVPAPFIEVATGDGSVAATSADIARYVAMLLSGGVWAGQRLLRTESFALLVGRQVRTAPGRWYGYGLGSHTLDGRSMIGHGGDMIGFRASLLADRVDGLGVAVLTNLRGAPTADLARFALRLARADRSGSPLPALEPVGLEDLRRAAGEYYDATRRIVVGVDGAQGWLASDDRKFELIGREADRFEVADPLLGRFVLRVERSRGRVVRVTHGPQVYRPGPARPAEPKRRRSTAAPLTGRYSSHNPWRRMFDVVDRLGRPVLVDADGSEAELIRLGRHRFREGIEPNPERIVFDAFVEGVPLRALASGHAYYRA